MQIFKNENKAYKAGRLVTDEEDQRQPESVCGNREGRCKYTSNLFREVSQAVLFTVVTGVARRQKKP